ncbi:MAG TPA: SIMPL domain-containing protein [Patescibacteria group bacterium]|nr:SIMPL domain-containing protein [Patescibacteria group bacterium]
MKRFWPTIKNPLITAGFVLLGMFLYVNFTYMLPFGYHKTNPNAVFTAEGTGETTYVPDTALISLGVNKTATTQEEAKNQTNEIINKITEDLKKLGIAEKNIKTTNFSVYEDYTDVVTTTTTLRAEETIAIMPERPTKPNGYTASANIEVRAKPLDTAEQVIDIATKDGATQVGTYQMVVDEDKQKELETEARLEAIKNAKEKAKELSDAAGIRLGRVISIQEGGAGYPRPLLMKADMAGGTFEAAAPTELNPGENTISISVTLSFETY